MRKIIYLALLICPILSIQHVVAASNRDVQSESSGSISLAQNNKRQRLNRTRPISKTPKKQQVSVGRKAPASSQAMSLALSQVRAGQYAAAIPVLFQLSRKPEFLSERDQIKYILGTALMEVDLNQVAAFQFVEVIKSGSKKYLKQSLEKLSLAADRLGDDTLLNYAVSRVNVDDFPATSKDMIYYRLGEVRLRSGKAAEATSHFSKVPHQSRYFYSARYQRALALAEQGRAQEAAKEFQDLVRSRGQSSVTDDVRVNAQMGLARSLYQAQDWEGSVQAYRQIPRDHEVWHQALFESSWALLRAARFRSALSQFQSLHSAFYEDTYLPESLLLRGIVYLYICKYDELEKVLGLFDRTYGPIVNQIQRVIDTSDSAALFREVEAADLRRKSQASKNPLRLHPMVSRRLLNEGDLRRGFLYLKSLQEESIRLDSLPFVRNQVGTYARRVINQRMRNARIAIGEQTKVHLINLQTELRDLQEQSGFLRYEMINGEKELIKKRISGKTLPDSIDEKIDRTFYVQNGYEYWPFQGEYWIDEIGNYHYLGKSSCQ